MDQISGSTSPTTLDNRFYTRTGLEGARADSTLYDLVEGEIQLRNAWVAYWGCTTLGIAIADLIVELDAADARVADHGLQRADLIPRFLETPDCYAPVYRYAFGP